MRYENIIFIITVNSSTCNAQPNDPVCDTDGQTHQTPCHLLLTGKKLDYFGTCINKCLKVWLLYCYILSI